MKSNAFGVGNANLKGRKTKRLRCGCCDAVNFKQDELKKIHRKEMRDALVGQLVESPVTRPESVSSSLTKGTNNGTGAGW